MGGGKFDSDGSDSFALTIVGIPISGSIVDGICDLDSDVIFCRVFIGRKFYWLDLVKDGDGRWFGTYINLFGINTNYWSLDKTGSFSWLLEP